MLSVTRRRIRILTSFFGLVGWTCRNASTPHQNFTSLFFPCKIYLCTWKVEWQTKRFSDCWFVPHVARSGPGWRHEPGAPPWFPTWTAGPEGLRLTPVASLGTLAGNWLGSRAAGTQTSPLLWDTGKHQPKSLHHSPDPQSLSLMWIWTHIELKTLRLYRKVLQKVHGKIHAVSA